MSAVDAYDVLAPHYKFYAENRKEYLERIEKIVIARSNGAQSLLDVGAGDGVRGLRIAKSANIKTLVLMEPSAGMRAQCRERADFWTCEATGIPDVEARFEVITCLWNVFGHIRSGEERLLALSRLKLLLSPSGSIFLDVNYRYNAASYGWTITLLRMMHDFFFRSERNGDVIVSWRIDGLNIRTRGHVFTQTELHRIFRAAGLKIKGKWVVNYSTGVEYKSPLRGNLLYQLVL